MKRSLPLVFLFAAGIAPAASAQEVIKFGYVDMGRAVEETEDGRKARASLKKELDQRQKELNEREEELKTKIEDFKKKRSLLSVEQVAKTEQDLGAQMQKLQETMMRHQQTLQQKEAEALQPILERMQRIIFKMAQAENFTVIMDKRAGIIFAKPHLDLTNELIRRFNSGEAKDEVSRPGGAKPGAPAGGAKPAAPAAPKK